MNKLAIKLMTTEGCHLCEQAFDMLRHLLSTKVEYQNLFEIEGVEISDSDSLVNEYGIRIPVLVINKQELAWPFEIDVLECWLKRQGNL